MIDSHIDMTSCARKNVGFNAMDFGKPHMQGIVFAFHQMNSSCEVFTCQDPNPQLEDRRENQPDGLNWLFLVKY